MDASLCVDDSLVHREYDADGCHPDIGGPLQERGRASHAPAPHALSTRAERRISTAVARVASSAWEAQSPQRRRGFCQAHVGPAPLGRVAARCPKWPLNSPLSDLLDLPTPAGAL